MKKPNYLIISKTDLQCYRVAVYVLYNLYAKLIFF